MKAKTKMGIMMTTIVVPENVELCRTPSAGSAQLLRQDVRFWDWAAKKGTQVNLHDTNVQAHVSFLHIQPADRTQVEYTIIVSHAISPTFELLLLPVSATVHRPSEFEFDMVKVDCGPLTHRTERDRDF